MRTFNLRLILWLAGIFVVTAVVVHFVHDYQVHKNAGAFLDRALKSETAVRTMAEDKTVNPEQIRDAVIQTRRHYSRYLSLKPDDLATRIQYARFVLDIRDLPAAFFQNDKILRTDLAGADEKLRKDVEEVRDRQIDLAIHLKRISDALYHIDIQKDIRKDDPKLMEMRGRCELSREDSRAANEKAQADFERAIELAPDQISAYAALASLQRVRMDQPALAEATIARMIAANPESAEAYVSRAQFLLSDKEPARPDTLSDEQRELFNQEKDPAKRLELLQVHVISRATADCEKARQLDPRNATALGVFAECLERAAPFQSEPKQRVALLTQARDLIDELIQVKPLFPQLYLQLSNLELKIGREQATKESTSAGATAAVDALRRGMDALKEVTLAQPETTFHLRWRLVDLLLGDKQPGSVEEVEALLKQLKSEQPDSPILAYIDARQDVINQQWLSARKKLEETSRNLAPWPDLVKRANLMLGICYSQLEDHDLRLRIAQKAVDENLLDVNARIELAETLLLSNRSSEALQQYAEIVRLRTPTPAVLQRYAMLILAATVREDASSRNWGPVSSLIDAVDQMSPEDPWVPVMRAEVLVSQEKPAEAQKVLEEARQKYPNDFTFGNALLELAQQQKDYEQAARRLEELQQQFGDTLNVRSARARYLIKTEGTQALPKLAELAQGLDQFPENERFQFYWQLARICLQLSDTEGGLRYGQEAAKLIPNNIRLRLFLLDVARVGKDVQVAEQLVSEIEKLEEGGPVSLYAAAMLDLIRHQADQADTLGDAQKKLAEAARQRNDWPDIPVLQGIVAAVQGDPKAALEHYKRAIYLGNLNTSIVFQVASSMYREGKLDEADRLVRKVQEQRSGLPLEMGRLASRINFSREQYDRALELAESIPKESNAIEDAFWVGYLQMINKEYDAAAISLQGVVDQQPDSLEGWLNLVRCLKDGGKEEQAVAKMEEGVTKIKAELQPQLRSECLRVLGKPEEAVANYREAVKAHPDSPAVLRPAADLFLAAAETRPEAQAILQRLVGGEVNVDPSTLQWARRNLARLLSGGDYADRRRAIELVKANLAEKADSAEDLQLQSRLLASSPRVAERHEALKILQQLDNDRIELDNDSRYMLAKQRLADGDWTSYSEQMVKLLAASQKTPRNKVYLSEYINALLDHGGARDALTWAGVFQKNWGNEITAALILAKVQAAGSRPQVATALATIKKAVDDPKIEPTDKKEKMGYAVNGLQMIVRQLNNYLADLRETAGDGSKVDQAANSPPEERAARLEIAQAIERQIGPVTSTIEEYITEIVGEDPQLQLLWIPYLVGQGKNKEAAELFQQHWQEARFDLLTNAFGALLSQTDIDSADRGAVEALLVEAIQRSQDRPEELVPLLRIQGGYHVKWARYDEAIACYRQITSLVDDDINSLNNLAMLMASQKQDLDAALAAINKAVDLIGPVATYLDSQAMVLLAAGKKAESLEAMKRVVAEKPDRITKESAPTLAKKWGGYYFHLALAYQANGNLTAAAEQMKEAETLGFTKEDVFTPELEAYETLKKQM